MCDILFLEGRVSQDHEIRKFSHRFVASDWRLTRNFLLVVKGAEVVQLCYRMFFLLQLLWFQKLAPSVRNSRKISKNLAKYATKNANFDENFEIRDR